MQHKRELEFYLNSFRSSELLKGEVRTLNVRSFIPTERFGLYVLGRKNPKIVQDKLFIIPHIVPYGNTFMLSAFILYKRLLLNRSRDVLLVL